MSKESGKVCGYKVAFKQEIAIYIFQNETMAVFLALSKRGNFFGHLVCIDQTRYCTQPSICLFS